MPETEEQRRMREADQAARSMFGGGLFAPNFLQRAGAALTSARVPSERELLPPSQIASPSMPRLGPLVRTDYGLPPSERPEFRNPAEQWDARPVAARTAAATAPQPAAPSLAAAPVPQFPATGMGLMGNQNIRPLPTEQISPMARFEPTLADRGAVTTDITGMQGKTPIQTPYGTIYATAEQAAKPRVAEIAGLPAQSARLERIGEEARRNVALRKAAQAGRELGRRNVRAMESYFAQQRAEAREMREAIDRARAAGISSEIIARGAQDFQRSRPTTMPQIRSAFAPFAKRPEMEPQQRGFASNMFGLQNQGFSFSGGPQPLTGFSQPSSFIENQNRNPFGSIYGFGV